MDFKLLFLILSVLFNLYSLYKLYFKHRENVNYEATAEYIYRGSFMFFVSLVAGATVGTFFLHKVTGQTVTLVPEAILKFTKEVILLFIIPVTVKLAGAWLRQLTEFMLATKGISSKNMLNQENNNA